MVCTYYVNMTVRTNITLAIDPELLSKARIVALRRHTSVTQLVREHLEMLVIAEDQAFALRQSLLSRLETPALEVGKRAWTREDLYDRR